MICRTTALIVVALVVSSTAIAQTPPPPIVEFPVPTANSGPNGITAGPDGNMWFTETNARKIGRITPAGVITEFPVPNTPIGIAGGPDGNVWFTARGASGYIARMTPIGTVTEFDCSCSDPDAITAGPDGNMWFIYQVGQIVHVQDVNGDNNADLVWYYSGTGFVATWLMDGTTVTSTAAVATLSAGEQIQ